MKCNLEEILTQVVSETFESMVYMRALDTDACEEDTEASRTCASITFSGSSSGSLLFSVPRSILHVIACNILGQDANDPISMEDQQDALKEVLNVICGNLLPRLFNPHEVFDVHQPRIVSNAEIAAISEIYGDDEPEAIASVRLDYGRVAIAMWLDCPTEVIDVGA
jgi:hypothetical protein